MSTQIDTIEIRPIATELILDAAREVDALAVSEHLDEQGTDDAGDGITEQILELVRTATVTVGWPVAEADGPPTEPDVAAWCRQRAANHRTYEEHELPLYEDRDVALIEWNVRCLGNPLLPGARAVLAVIALQHGLVLTDPDA